MSRLTIKKKQAEGRKRRVRAKINGTSKIPRLAVKISNKAIYAQLIDDESGNTLISASSATSKAKTMSEKAVEVGAMVADEASKAKIKSVVLDRSSKKYHGRIKALADSAREKGLKV